jgi:hypothetical protein
LFSTSTWRKVFGKNRKGRGRLIFLVDNTKGDISPIGRGRLIPKGRRLRTIFRND